MCTATHESTPVRHCRPAQSGHAVRAAGAHPALDVRLPPTFIDEGLQAALAAPVEMPGLPILVLFQHVEQLYARELLADKGGGVGYLLKDRVSNVGQLIDAVQRVAGGGMVMDPEVVSQLLARNAGPDWLGELTAREREVLGLMSEGPRSSSLRPDVRSRSASRQRSI
ncbi:hypothetical protein GA0074695_5885 [Micromonospora viridifaciens]|uniref:DNA-binding response regulator, NarL/FixJ family, contains REC and HTH domains n=1 Tax=Micromonospora viridifaciens TaxID=1881 RepID=A0A1C4ZPP1_MICVI|nr:response regulator transcription factor [Micromonospora viridifaciens]SCF34756.1 hypothetical protein GA0074695_5885 [Micromonospora viridifaciens]